MPTAGANQTRARTDRSQAAGPAGLPGAAAPTRGAARPGASVSRTGPGSRPGNLPNRGFTLILRGDGVPAGMRPQPGWPR